MPVPLDPPKAGLDVQERTVGGADGSPIQTLSDPPRIIPEGGDLALLTD